MPPIQIPDTTPKPVVAIASATIDLFNIELSGTPIQIFEMLNKLCGDNEYSFSIHGVKKEEIPRWADQVEMKSST